MVIALLPAATSGKTCPVAIDTTRIGRPEEIAGLVHDEAGHWARSVVAVEGCQVGNLARRGRYFKYCAGAVGAARDSRAIEIAALSMIALADWLRRSRRRWRSW